MHPVTLTLQLTHPELNDMPKPTPRDWEEPGRELHAVGVRAEEIDAARRVA